MWPARDLAPHARPLLRAAPSAACACSGRAGSRSRSPAGCGRRRSPTPGHTCDRVPLAISEERCVNAKWCHTGCIFGAKNSLITNYLWAAENAGVQVRPNIQVEQITQSSARPYRYVVTGRRDGQRGAEPDARADRAAVQLECKVLVLAAGAMGTPPLLMRSRPSLPALSAQVGQQPGRQRRPRRGGRVRPGAGPVRARPRPATTSSTRASRSRR